MIISRLTAPFFPGDANGGMGVGVVGGYAVIVIMSRVELKLAESPRCRAALANPTNLTIGVIVVVGVHYLLVKAHRLRDFCTGGCAGSD